MHGVFLMTGQSLVEAMKIGCTDWLVTHVQVVTRHLIPDPVACVSQPLRMLSASAGFEFEDSVFVLNDALFQVR